MACNILSLLNLYLIGGYIMMLMMGMETCRRVGRTVRIRRTGRNIGFLNGTWSAMIDWSFRGRHHFLGSF